MGNYSSHILSESTQVTLLLCGRFGGESDSSRPLTTAEHNRFFEWLKGADLAAADLLDLDTSTLAETIGVSGFDGERMGSLMARGSALAIALEQWTNIGLWVVGLDDAEYPELLKKRLGNSAPPVLYGAGNRKLLSGGGLAIVGSRNADEEALAFAGDTARGCAREEIAVISGAARGVDSEAMLAAVESGGNVVGVLAENLEREMVSGKSRDWVSSHKLLLVSPFHPRAVFNIGNAMERNKLIYALSDYAMVVSAEKDKGGTWNGAVENLKHSWVPLFVRDDPSAPDGNRGLIKRGGIAFAPQVLHEVDSLQDWMEAHKSEFAAATSVGRRKGGGSKQQSLL